MSTTNDGGPAFPHDWWNHPSGECQPEPPHYGMSLRDYFAAKALQGILARGIEIHDIDEELGKIPDLAAKMAYRFADEMLKAKGGTEFAEQAKLSVLVVACEGLLSIIHDDLTHERQRDHAAEIQLARDAIADAKG